METLKNINLQSCNDLYNENNKYLINLYKINNFINIKLNNTKIKHKILYKIIDYLHITQDLNFNNINIKEHNNLLYFLSELFKNIILLKNDIPDYINITEIKLKIIYDEYMIFHNNIIKKIIRYINYYNDYIIKLNTIYDLLKKNYDKLYSEYNIFILNYNSNEICRIDPNFSRKKYNFEINLNILIEYNNYITNEINNYNSIKIKINNFDIIFLTKIKNLTCS